MAASMLAAPRGGCSPPRAVWDESLTLADLRAQLDAAIKMEDYTMAAKIRDTIQQKEVDVRLAVEDANKRFYDAFRSGNIKEMEEIWGRGDHVQVIHPGANCIAGHEQVLESWRRMLRNVRPGAFKITVDEVRVFATESHGYVTCVEIIDADDSQGWIVATNVFEKQGGRWVITLHHGSAAKRLRKVPL